MTSLRASLSIYIQDNIESNIDNAGARVDHARLELEEAKKEQVKETKKFNFVSNRMFVLI